MSIREKNLLEDIKEWASNPYKLLFWFTALLVEAEICPSDSLIWSAKDGLIQIATRRTMKKMRVED